MAGSDVWFGVEVVVEGCFTRSSWDVQVREMGAGRGGFGIVIHHTRVWAIRHGDGSLRAHRYRSGSPRERGHASHRSSERRLRCCGRNGGHAAGEVAWQMAIDVAHSTLVGASDPDETRLARETGVEDAADILRERLRYAMNQALCRFGVRPTRTPSSVAWVQPLWSLSSTATKRISRMLVIQERICFAMGACCVSRGITRSCNKRLTRGRPTPELARMPPHKNVLTQSVGFHGLVEPDTTTRMVLPGDRFILCSDGLSDPLEDQEIERIVASTPRSFVRRFGRRGASCRR